MPRYVALLRGVSPMNLKMPSLKRALEVAGFTHVKTLLSSGNVAFDARKAAEASLQAKVEKAVEAETGRFFLTIVRSQDDLKALLEADAFASFKIKPVEKKVITFLRGAPKAKLDLPIEKDGGRILAIKGSEVYTAYMPNMAGAGFMGVLEKALGKDQTTRTWDTVRKCSLA